MAVTSLSQIMAFMESGAEDRESTAEHLVAELSRLTAGQFPWPPDALKRCQLHYAILLEQDGRPFWALAPRFYWMFDFDWPSKPVYWVHYHVAELHDRAVGDPAFPELQPPDNVVLAALATKSVVTTHVPGELLVAFQNGTSRSEVDDIVARAISGTVTKVISVPQNLYEVRCRLFGEPADTQKLESEPKVRHTSLNFHVSLIPPGGRWYVQRLL